MSAQICCGSRHPRGAKQKSIALCESHSVPGELIFVPGIEVLHMLEGFELITAEILKVFDKLDGIGQVTGMIQGF